MSTMTTFEALGFVQRQTLGGGATLLGRDSTEQPSSFKVQVELSTMDRYLALASRPSSAMSQNDEEERPVTPAPIQLSQDSASKNVMWPASPCPRLMSWSSSKITRAHPKTRWVLSADPSIATRTSSLFGNLKIHYKNLHPTEHDGFFAALTAGYAYKKRGRNSSGAR
jgi:hypothetical protein